MGVRKASEASFRPSRRGNVVRVGIEDAYWKYPHRDEVIQKNLVVIELAVEFAEMLGRSSPTPTKRGRSSAWSTRRRAKVESVPVQFLQLT
ncbi:hypothetical protein ACFFQF_12390 [Haladaptatus pallidirubidus]|uniref:hypothetical protein n=1 Tax=Haladaptatus pallidirubidus TaxID=1008152 RepID=UPI001D11D385|nr:hypothetical protein [Haladaptatus pallidirubidus]